MDIQNLILTFVVGIFASIVGILVGAGGLISIPFMIFIGLPPHVAIATHKLGAIGMKAGALTKFWTSGHIKWSYVIPLCVISALAAVVGSMMLIEVDKGFLTDLVLFLLLAMLPLLVLKKDIGIIAQKTTRLKQGIGYVFYFFAQVFGAFFGGGAATIVMYVFMYFFGLPVVNAMATGMIPSVVLNTVALIVLHDSGYLNVEYGIALLLGMIIGGQLGAKTAIKKGNAWVKTLLVIVVVVLIIKIWLER